MAAYIEFDGVDDRLQIPGVVGGTNQNFTGFEADILVTAREDWHQIFNLGGKAVNFQSNTLNIVIAADFDSVTVNGTPGAGGTAFIPVGERVVVKGILKSGITTGNGSSALFWNFGASYLAGRMYGLKMYQGTGATTLAAEYSAETGNTMPGFLEDLTGNGRHATLVGGTWGSDGQSEPVGEDVMYSFPTRQRVTANRSVVAVMQQNIFATRSAASATKQVSFANRLTPVAMKQTYTASRSTTAAARQVITAQRSESFAMLLQLYSGYVEFSASYPLGVAITAQRDAQASVQARITAVRAVEGATSQRVTAGRSEAVSTIQRITGVRVARLSFRQSIAAERLYTFAMRQSWDNPDLPTYKRIIPFKVMIERKMIYKVGIVSRKRYDLKW